MSQHLVDSLRKQADALEQQMVAMKLPQLNVQPIPDIQALIAAEIAKVMPKQVTPPVVNTEVAVMLDLLGRAYTTDQQMWISANLKDLPAFIVSDNGKAALGMLLEEFQAFLKPK